MQNILKDERAIHPAVTGIIIVALVGIMLGLMVMVYAPTSDATLKGTFRTTTNSTFNDTSATGSTGVWIIVSPALASADSSTVYSITMNNATETFVLGTDFNASYSNSSVQISHTAGGPLKNTTNTIVYSSEGTGVTTQRSVTTNMFSGFNMSAIAPIVLAAGLIITIVVMFTGMVLSGKD